jgi:hypothetical protein
MPAASALSATAAGVWMSLPPLATRMTLNLALLAASLVLECALAWVVFRRGIAPRFPGFTALLLFYPLRAAALFVLARSVDPDTYDSLFTWLEAAEIPLLAWVCVELVQKLVRRAGGWSLRISLAVLVLVAVAFNLAWIALSAVPERGLADRVQFFAGIFLVELFAVAWRLDPGRAGRYARNLVRIPAGFAAYAVFQFAALAGRAHAVAQHAAGAYVGWSYVPACGFLAVVVFWLFALRRED